MTEQNEVMQLETGTVVWDAAASAIRTRVNEFVWNAWFKPIRAAAGEDGGVRLEIHDQFTRDWIWDHYRYVIEEALQEVAPRFNTHGGFTLVVNPALQADLPPPSPSSGEVMVQSTPERTAERRSLNEKYVFSSFVVGASNQFAYAASRAVADKPALAYNPLFLFGGVGLGKTHLIHAIAHGILERNPHWRVIYTSSEQFMNEVVNGIRYGKMEEFHNKYRKNCDVLLMDDIQLIAGKDRTQEEFFHTFNTLYELKKQIVVSSDKLPHEIPGLEERMRTRFQWGLIADIQPPEIETRIAILKKKAEAEHFELPNEVAMYLAENIRSNVRELEGALIRIIAHASLTNSRISIEYARGVLAELLAGRRHQVSVESIQKVVATYYNVKVSDLKSQRRHKVVAKPRQVAMYLCRKLLNASYPELGDRFGGKDHTTILSACRKMEALNTKDNQLRTEMLELQRKIQDS
jgi:chromosomal replication initiator protein